MDLKVRDYGLAPEVDKRHFTDGRAFPALERSGRWPTGSERIPGRTGGAPRLLARPLRSPVFGLRRIAVETIHLDAWKGPLGHLLNLAAALTGDSKFGRSVCAGPSAPTSTSLSGHALSFDAPPQGAPRAGRRVLGSAARSRSGAALDLEGVRGAKDLVHRKARVAPPGCKFKG